MNTKDFRTKTITKEIVNGLYTPGTWVIGLDVGYSAVKTVSPNIYNSIPAYAEKQDENEALSPLSDIDDNISYKDENGNTWLVGAGAQNAIKAGDTSAGSLAIYGRDRYYNDMFLVLTRVGIAAGMRKNLGVGARPMVHPYNNDSIFVATGLPPQYKDSDEEQLREVLTGPEGKGRRHTFRVKFNGSNQYELFDFILTSENLDVTDQPVGTMYSVMTGPNWNIVQKDATHSYNSYELSRSNMLIVDPGFGTLDVEAMRAGRVRRKLSQTFDNLGMKQVFIDSCEEIKQKFNFEISVPGFQKYLEQGYVLQKKSRTEYIPQQFDDILAKHNSDICNKALDKIIEIYNPAVDYQYLVLTGGTGAAWMNEWQNNTLFARNRVGLQLIPGNAGDPSVPYIMQNARGYYICAAFKVMSAQMTTKQPVIA